MPTSDNFTGINDTNILAAQQDSDSRLGDLMQNNPKQFASPESIQQPEAPKGLYGTVNPGENINTDKTSYAYNATDYNNQMANLTKKYPGSNGLPDVLLPQSETNRYTGNDYGFKIDRNNESFYEKQQGFWKTLGNVGANLVGKSVAYAAQNAGFILGAPLAPFDISNMTDNFLVRAGEWLKDKTASDFPIYKSDKYSQGNIWQKLGTIGWWADDAIDRVALTAAMFLPGFAEAKGLGLFGTALDEAGNLRATGVATKAIQSLAANPESYGQLGKTFLSKLYKAAAEGTADAGVQPALRSYAQNLSRGELYAWNVIGQSGLNAKETQDAIMKATGDKDKAADGAMKSFWETVPLALLGSLVEIPQMFSTKNTAKSILNKVFNKETGESIEDVLAFKGTSVGKTLLKAIGTGFEHGQNESMQVAVSRYNEESAEGKDKRGTLKGIFGDFLDNVNDPNGQNNIALGTIQGILMTLGGKGWDKFVSHKTANENSQAIAVFNAINAARMNRRIYNADFNQRDDQGKVIVDSNGRPIKDQQKITDAGLSLVGSQNSVELKHEALEQGNYTGAALVDHKMLSAFAYNFFSDSNGMEHLSNILKLEAKANENNPDRINDIDENGNEITPQVQLQRNLSTVNELRKVYNAIDQRHAGFMNLDVDKKNKDEIKQASNFINELKYAQYNEASKQIFLDNELYKNEKEMSSLDVESGFKREEGDRIRSFKDKKEREEYMRKISYSKIEGPSNPLEERYNDLYDINEQLDEVLNESKEKYKTLVNKKLQKDTFNIQKEFNKTVEEKAEKKAEFQSKQEPVEQATPVQQPAVVNNPTPQNQAQAPATTQQTAPVQAESTLASEITPMQALLTKRNEDLAAAKTEEEKKNINLKYIQDVRALSNLPNQAKSKEQTDKKASDIKKLIPIGKIISKDELEKVSTIINEEAKEGNITPEQEKELFDTLDKKKVVGTALNTEQDYEDETPETPQEEIEKQEEEQPKEITPEHVNDSSPEQKLDEDIQPEQEYDPSTVDQDLRGLESSVYSSLAYQTSNKTVTQEEGVDRSGRFNNTLDEEPYKQFIQGYLRFLNQNGFPVDGLHGKVIKDNQSIPHSEETSFKILTDGYGSVLVITDMDRNILHFDENYNSSPDKREGTKPIAFSFTSQYFDDLKGARAQIGEERTGISADEFLKQYQNEKEQQELARQLNDKGKEVNVEITGISKGVIRKSQIPVKSSDVISEDMKAILTIPSSSERYDPQNPDASKYVTYGNQALLNGALYAETIDPKTSVVAYTRLIPNKIGDIPDLFTSITELLNHTYTNKNQAAIVRDHLKDILFLGRPKRPNLTITENEDGSEYNVRLIDGGNLIDPEATITFLSDQRLNITRSNINNDNYNQVTLKEGKILVSEKNNYRDYILQNSTTVDIPVQTSEGSKFIPLNTYAAFHFLDSVDAMKARLTKKESTPEESAITYSENETSVFRHGQSNEDITAKNSGKNNIPLNTKGKEDAKSIGDIMKRLGVKKILASSIERTMETARIAAKQADIKEIIPLSIFRTWDIGDFTSQPDDQFDERWFVMHPDEVSKDGKNLGESFNSFLSRAQQAYKFIRDNTDKQTAIISHSRNIRIWSAIKENNGFWNENALEGFLNKNTGYDYTSIKREEAVKDNSSLTKQPLRRLGKVETKSTEQLAREQDEEDKKGLEGLKASPDTREDLPLLGDREIHEVNRIFGEKVAKRVNEIFNSDIRALWTTSGIKLFRDARKGDGYHEAWHHFSQLYLTQEEKRSLYDEARKKGVDFITRDGRKLNTKSASDFEVEEMMADDFRDYVNNNGTSRLVNRPYRNNIFRKIIDFLKKFFFGDVNIDKLYDDLYKGNLSKYKPSINNAMWGKLNSKAIDSKGDEIVDNQKAAYYRDVVDYLMGEELLAAKTSVESLRKNRKLSEAIYTNIYNELVDKYYNPLLDKADIGQDINQEVAEDLHSILTNWQGFVDYHKKASKLFLNINHEILVDVPENPEDVKVDTDLGSEDFEIKDENEEQFGENEVDKDVMQSDRLYDVAGNEQSSIQAASIQTRGLIRMLPAIDYNNGRFTILMDDNGFPRLNDYAKTWNNIAYELSDLNSYDEMIQKLRSPDILKKIPEVSRLLQHLPSPDKEHTPSEINTITAFRTDFNRAYVGIYSGKMYPDGQYFLNEETKRNNDQVKRLWTANFYNKTSTDPDIQADNILLDQETGKYYLNPGRVLNYNPANNVSKEQLLNLIGFSFSDEAKKDRFYSRGFTQVLSDIQVNINLRHQAGQKIYNPIFDLSRDLKNPNSEDVIVRGINSVLQGLVYFQAKYASDVPSLSYQTAEGEMIYGLSLNHTLSIISNKINKAKSYDDIRNDASVQHLNYENNPNVRGSLFLNYMFSLGSTNKRLIDKEGSTRKIIVGNYNGFKQQDNEGNTVGYSTTNLNVRQKAIFDISSLLSRGVVEVMRTESSKSAYFIKLNYYTKNDADISKTYLPIGFSELPEGFNSPRLMTYMIDNYLFDELNRMKTADNIQVFKNDPKLMQAAKGFNLFRDILRIGEKNEQVLKDSIKSDLEKMSTEKVIEKHRDNIEKAINNFFMNELKSLKEGLEEENITGADMPTNLSTKSFDQQLRAFVVNDFLLNVEYTKLFNGDTIYQAHYKDYFKRSKGDISTGKTPITDDLFVRHMRSIERSTFGAFAQSTYANDYKSFRTINLKDDTRDSKYIDTYKKDLMASDSTLTSDEIDRWLEKYKDMKIADGQGYITLDFYRQFLKSINNWSDAQEMGYKVELAKYRLANKAFNPEYSNEMQQYDREFLKANPQNFSYYPPLKIQYNGPIKAVGTGAMVMDKFSVVPLIPSILQNTPLEQIHNEMLKAGIGYAKYASGTKKYIHPPIEIYNEDGFQGLDLSKHEPATHFLDYLKEQINTNPKIKSESIFGSQIRKLIEANIFSNGNADPIDIDRHARYKSYIKGIRDLGKKELYKEIGLSEVDGKTRIGDMQKFISTIQEQAEMRELNDNVKDYIQYDKDTKKLKYALETSLNRRPIQDLLMGIVDRRLRVQKLSGDQLIQISSSGYQSNDFKYKNATDDEIKKYGTNGLRFYHLEYENGKPKSIVSATVKVGLSTNGFDKLLNKVHPDGNKIRTLERLNELLKDDNWRKENEKSITLIGYRIPTQGFNSMEHLEVAEFLPPHVGSSIIVPAEIVAKSGSDFDIDKMSIFRPSFDENGEIVSGESKEGYSNKIINLFSEILSDPKIFKQLIRPNDTDLVKPETNEVAVAIGKRSSSDIKDPKPYSGTQIYRYKNNLRKFETLLSAKKLLSIFAVNNTFSTIMQQAGTLMNMKYGLEKSVNRDVKLFLLSLKERAQVVKDGKIQLGSKYSVDGNFKQDFYSQLINATVDAASDDFFGYVNMSYENVNVLCHLINQGVPYNRAIWFLNQPVLLRYYADMRKRQKGTSKNAVKAALLGELRGKSFFQQNEETGRMFVDSGAYNKDINDILNDPRLDKLFLSKDVLKKFTVKNKDVEKFLEDSANKTYNSVVLAYFISLQEQAGLFRDLQKVSSYDTTKIASPTIAYNLIATSEQIKANKLFDIDEVKKITTKSVIGDFDSKIQVATIGAALMPVAFNPTFMSKSISIIKKNTSFVTRAAQKKFINNYETQWIEYVVKSLGKIGQYSIPQYTRMLQEGKNSLPRRFNDLIGKYPELKQDYALVNKLRPNFPNQPNVKKNNIEVYRLFENTVDDQNRYIAEFRNLININSKKYSPTQNLEIQKFFRDLAILGFTQSGFSKSNISFQDIVPYEELADIFKTTLDNFNKFIAKDPSLLLEYVKQYQAQFNSNQKGQKQPWRGRDYYLTDSIDKAIKNKAGKPEEVKKTQVNTQTEPEPSENVIKPKYENANIRDIAIQMQPDNIEKILKGTKTTTTRSESQVKQIGLEPGEFGNVKFGNKEFLVRYRGMQTIDEAGGKDSMLKSEGVDNVDDFKYQQTKDWFNGKGKLGIYEILDPSKTIAQLKQEELLQPLVKTERQYWPGYEMQDSAPEMMKAMGKAGFKHAMDNLLDADIDYLIIDSNKDPKNIVWEDEDDWDSLKPENFENAIKILDRFKDQDSSSFFIDENGDEISLYEISNILSKVKIPTGDDNYVEYSSLDKLFDDYQKQRIPDDLIDEVEKILSDYGLMKYKDYNPNQLRLFTDKDYEDMLNQCK